MTELTIATIVVMIYGVLNAGATDARWLSAEPRPSAPHRAQPDFRDPHVLRHGDGHGRCAGARTSRPRQGPRARAPTPPARHVSPRALPVLVGLRHGRRTAAVPRRARPHPGPTSRQAGARYLQRFQHRTAHLPRVRRVRRRLSRTMHQGGPRTGRARHGVNHHPVDVEVLLRDRRGALPGAGVRQLPRVRVHRTAPGGALRFRGILSEPAGLAVSCVVAISYTLPRSFQVHGWRRVGALVVAGAAAYMGDLHVRDFRDRRHGRRRHRRADLPVRVLDPPHGGRRLAGIVACGMVVAALWVLPIITDSSKRTVDAKVSSSSYNNRAGSDSFAYDLFFNTFGFGTGLGSSRASSFLPGLLSATGLIGTSCSRRLSSPFCAEARRCSSTGR